MTHNVLPLSELAPLYAQTPPIEYDWDPVCSPFNVWCQEKLRAQVGAVIPEDQKIPADVLVWGRGEPAKLGTTKIGGTPVWCMDREPPQKLSFVGQIGLMDSPQALAKVEGDVLSIWADDEFPYGAIKVFALDSRSLTHLPEAGLVTVVQGKEPFYGVMHRSFDVPRSVWEKLGDLEVEGQFGPRTFGFVPWVATKIGGRSSVLDERRDQGFVAQLMSLQAHPEQPYPWCNVKEPLAVSSALPNSYSLASNQVEIGDMGFVTLTIKNGVIKASLSV